MENSLSYVIFCWFFATTAHQQIIFMFLVKTKLVSNSAKVYDFPHNIHGENKKKNNLLSELCERGNRCFTCVLDFHTRNIRVTSKFLSQGYRYHKLRKTSFYRNLVLYRSKKVYQKESSIKSFMVI